MRDKHKHLIKDQLINNGFTLDEITTQDLGDGYRISYKDSPLHFSFYQSMSDPNNYSYKFIQNNLKLHEVVTSYQQHFDIVFQKFTDWLVTYVRPYQEDKNYGDPFKTHQESKGFIFNEAEIIDDNPEDESPFTTSEQETFAKELKAFESGILAKSLLQEKEIESLKKSVNLLIEASKTESKSEVKKGVGKLLNDLAIELIKYGVIEGAKKYLLPLLISLGKSHIDPHWIA